MTSSLFQEALADAKQLKEVAEQNAKNAIIDAVTPKIRKFIEDQLLEGAKKADPELEESEEIDLTTDSYEPVDDAASPEGLAERVGLLRAMSKIVESLTPEESATLIPVVEKMRSAALNKFGSARISQVVPSDVRSTHIVKENAAMQGKNKMYEVDLDELMSDEMSPEDEGMHMGHAGNEMSAYDEESEDEMADLYESLSELFEEKGEEDMEEEDAEEEDAEEEDAEEEDGPPIQPTGEEEEEEEEEGDAGGADATSDMGVPAEMAEIKDKLEVIEGMLAQLVSGGMAGAQAPEEAAPAPAGQMPPGAAPSPSERVYRVDETALLRELRALREGKMGMGMGMGKKAKKGALAHTDEGEEELDGDDTNESVGKGVPSSKGKLNPHHKVSAPFSEAAKTKVMKENRDLKANLVKHSEAVESLRGQLTEMNLFNAKLLYVNRLLQDRELSDSQRRNIIESLDRARSLREVKLLYKGLSESIGRKPAARKTELVSESVGSRAISPTSRPLSTSGVRMNEAVEVHRWAMLAGIGSKS
jgi:hypothetical protein